MAVDTAYHSVPGALVFWSYIVAALFLGGLIIGIVIGSRPPATPQAQRANNVFVALALLSFSTLSWNMLRVLIQSFCSWTPVRRETVIWRQVWEWSTTSTLFKDFGNALIAHQGTWAWSNATLGLTFLNVLYICAKGRRHRVPHLWAFVAVAEILPVSFAQNLFYLALLRSPQAQSGLAFGSNLPWIIGGAGYAASLVFAPSSGEYLIAIILVARAFLALPLLLDVETRPAGTAKHDQGRAGASIAFWLFGPLTVGVGLLPIMRSFGNVGFIRTVTSINDQPAVSALGYDLLVSLVSWLAWSRLRPSWEARKEHEAKSQ